MGANSALYQPQQALPIDRENLITRGLTAAILPLGAGPRDVIVNASPTLTGPLALANYPVGRAWMHGSGSYSLFDSPVYGKVGPNGGITEFVLLSVVSTDDWGCLWVSGDGVGQTTATNVYRISNTTNFTYSVDNGAVGVDTTGGEMTTLLDGAMHALLCTAGPGGVRIDLDGRTVASTTGIAVGQSNGRLIFARDISTNGSQATANYALYLRWDRQLSLAESKALKTNPWQVFYAWDARDAAFSVASGVSAALTGVAGTGSVGTTNVSADKSITGNAGTCAVGTVVPAVSNALTGNPAAAAIGTVTASTAKGLTGVAATGSAGTLAPIVDKALSGNAATGAAGTVSPQSSLTLTGAAGASATGVVTPNVTIPITGASASGVVGTVTASTGVFVALTGVAGTGSAGSVSPSTGQALTGNAVTGAVGSIAPATTKALTGNAATAAAGSVSAALSKALTGNAATGAAGTVSNSITVALAGVSATGAVGSVSAGADANQAITGVSGTGAAGTVSPSITVALAGVSGAGAVGSVTAGQPLTGVAGTGSVGTVSLSSSKAITGIEATGAIGSVSPNVTVALSGVESTGEVGTISFVAGDITIALTGVQATGAAGVLAVSGEFSAIAAAVWSYVLSNGKTAGQNVVEIRAMLDVLSPGFWNFAIEGTYTAADLLRVIAAVQAGKTNITALGAGAATVEFRAVDDSEVRVTADMQGSERTEVTLNAN